MPDHPAPPPGSRWLVSACLLGRACRYDGASKEHLGAQTLAARVRAGGGSVTAVCPEDLGGLGTPRPPAELAGGDGAAVLDGRARAVRVADGADVTAAFVDGARRALNARPDATHALLKARSPSCGCGATHRDGAVAPGDGVFAALLRRRGVTLATEDDLGQPWGRQVLLARPARATPGETRHPETALMATFTARDLLTPATAPVPPDASASACARQMVARQVRRLLVAGKRGETLGVVDDLALLSWEERFSPSQRWLDPDALRPDAGAAETLMVSPEVRCNPQTPLATVLWRLAESVDEAALVEEDGAALGFVTERSVVAFAAGQLDGAPTVERFESPRLFSCTPTERRAEGRAVLLRAQVRHLLVVQDGRLVGVLSARDLTREGWPSTVPTPADPDLRAQGPMLRDLVGREPVTIAPDMPVRAAALMMNDLGVGCLPIVRDGAPMGIVTRTDIARALAEQLVRQG